MNEILTLVRSNIKSLIPYSSARSLYKEGVLMDANESPYNPFGDGVELNRYPDSDNTELRSKLSLRYDLGINNCAVGNGSDELIDILFKIFCEPGKDNIIISRPTYGVYDVFAKVNDVQVIDVPLVNFELNEKEILNKADQHTKLIFICSPNNPTGNAFSYESIINIVRNSDAIVVIDQAYVEFQLNSQLEANQNKGENAASLLMKDVIKYKNLVLLRTFSKAFALAGVRLGYAFADKQIIELIQKVKLPYNVNTVTTDRVLKALDNQTLIDQNIQKIIAERDMLIAELKSFKEIKEVFPTEANFILFKINDADQVYRKLVEHGVIIRNRTKEPQLEDCLRVTVGTPEQNELFIESLREIVNN